MKRMKQEHVIVRKGFYQPKIKEEYDTTLRVDSKFPLHEGEVLIVRNGYGHKVQELKIGPVTVTGDRKKARVHVKYFD